MSESNLFGDPSGPNGGYVVLARKYRPKTFADLIGQEAMVRTIANSFELGRIPHAYMLTGVRGVGKTTTARLLARALNYKHAAIDKPTTNLDPPGENCQAIMASRHPDVFEMDAASRTGIGDIREILDSVRYAPVMARYKVYIIDEVHMLSTQAFNGLLKTLEEPPPHVKFIFATTEIRKVPVTVLSRCQRFDLKRVDTETLAQHLTGICAKEKVKVDPEGLMLIARAAEGSVRDALSLLDQAIVQKQGGEVRAEDIRDMLGLADRGRTLGLFEAIAKGDAKTAIIEARSQYDSGADPALILRDLLEIGHDAARAQALGDGARIIGGADWVGRIRTLAVQLSPAQLSRLWQMLLKALEETGKAPDPIAAVEMAIVRLCAAQSLPPPEEAARLLRDGGSWTAGKTGAAAKASAGETPAIQNSQLNKFEDLVTFVESQNKIDIQIALERMKPLRFGDNELIYAASDAVASDFPRKLILFLRDARDEDWRVRAENIQAAPVESLAEQRKREEARKLEELKRQPFIAEALKAFPGAEIVGVKLPESETSGDVVPMLAPAEIQRAKSRAGAQEGIRPMKDISQIMRQAQAMQAKIDAAQKKLEAMEVEGQAGGGLVKIRLSGKTALLGITVDPSILKAEEKEIVEDLVKAAHDDARRKLEEAQNEEMKGISGGLGILPGFKMPF